MTAASVNFADALFALGRYPCIDGDRPTARYGFRRRRDRGRDPDLTAPIDSGDQLVGFSQSRLLATFVTCDARPAVTLPPGLADDQAAAVSTAHAIAWYGLHDSQITAGDRC